MEVCIIDDDRVYQFLMKKTFEIIDRQIAVTSFYNGEDAIQTLRTSNSCCKIIFLDLNMPVMDGWEFIDEYLKLDQECRNHKIYIASSSINTEDLERAKTYNIIEDYITKPITKEKILKITSRV